MTRTTTHTLSEQGVCVTCGEHVTWIREFLPQDVIVDAER